MKLKIITLCLMFFSLEIMGQENYVKLMNAESWTTQRQEVLNLYRVNMFGINPQLSTPRFEVLEERSLAFEGLAYRWQVRAYFTSKKWMDILIYLPKDNKKSPLFLGYNFFGNHTVSTDKNIFLPEAWCANDGKLVRKNNRASEGERGAYKDRWPIAEMIKSGFGLATIHYGDIEPDQKDGFSKGIRSALKPKSWSGMGAYAWGLSRALDYLAMMDAVAGDKVAVFGHSRLGKAALWAGAQDERFAMVISNNSGCGGAALFKRNVGENIARVNKYFPNWFNDKFKDYSDREEALPFDQHMLLSLIAPRPLYVASASEDYNADPEGEFLALKACSKTYQLFGKSEMNLETFPETNEPYFRGALAYHLRQGKHEITTYDWQQYLVFAKKHFLK